MFSRLGPSKDAVPNVALHLRRKQGGHIDNDCGERWKRTKRNHKHNHRLGGPGVVLHLALLAVGRESREKAEVLSYEIGGEIANAKQAP